MRTIILVILVLIPVTVRNQTHEVDLSDPVVYNQPEAEYIECIDSIFNAAVDIYISVAEINSTLDELEAVNREIPTVTKIAELEIKRAEFKRFIKSHEFKIEVRKK